MKKQAIIIGGGISGLTTGIFLRRNGYDTLILEKNHVPGGACIGWERKGCYIDGCIHWLVGVKPNTATRKLWDSIGALSPEVQVLSPEDFYTIDFGNGKKLTIWSDIDKFQKELIEFAPEDTKQIKKFCKLIKRFGKINAPVDKPVDLMNLFELMKIGLTMAGDYYNILKTANVSCKEYAKKFKNPYIRKWVGEHMVADYNFMSMLYMLGHVVAKDGGIPVGGSKKFSDRVLDCYLSLGGEIRYNAEVENVNVENDTAVSVTLKNGEVFNADWIVSSIPCEHLLKKLLKGKYAVKKLDTRLKDRKTYPIYTYTSAIFKINADLSDEPISHQIYFDKPITLHKDYYDASFRNFSYDKTLKVPEGHTIVSATISDNDDLYFYWKDIKENGNYIEKKREIAHKLIEVYLTRHPELEGKIEVIDVTTPLTYERYLNGRHGSFQSFVETPKGKSLMQKGVIKGLKNFILSGQWILRSGGLPPAAITGKWAAQRICKKDKVKFKMS